MTKSVILFGLNSSSALLCDVFWIALSNTRTRDGKIVTQLTTPKSTPFAITIPRSRPKVNVIKQSAIKPAIVVSDEPATEVIVATIASSIALFVLPL